MVKPKKQPCSTEEQRIVQHIKPDFIQHIQKRGQHIILNTKQSMTNHKKQTGETTHNSTHKRGECIARPMKQGDNACRDVETIHTVIPRFRL